MTIDPIDFRETQEALEFGRQNAKAFQQLNTARITTARLAQAYLAAMNIDPSMPEHQPTFHRAMTSFRALPEEERQKLRLRVFAQQKAAGLDVAPPDPIRFAQEPSALERQYTGPRGAIADITRTAAAFGRPFARGAEALTEGMAKMGQGITSAAASPEEQAEAQAQLQAPHAPLTSRMIAPSQDPGFAEQAAGFTGEIGALVAPGGLASGALRQGIMRLPKVASLLAKNPRAGEAVLRAVSEGLGYGGAAALTGSDNPAEIMVGGALGGGIGGFLRTVVGPKPVARFLGYLESKGAAGQRAKDMMFEALENAPPELFTQASFQDLKEGNFGAVFARLGVAGAIGAGFGVATGGGPPQSAAEAGAVQARAMEGVKERFRTEQAARALDVNAPGREGRNVRVQTETEQIGEIEKARDSVRFRKSGPPRIEPPGPGEIEGSAAPGLLDEGVPEVEPGIEQVPALDESPELARIHQHPARLKGFASASEAEIGNYVKQVRRVAESRLGKEDSFELKEALSFLDDAEGMIAQGDVRPAQAEIERVVSRLHEQEALEKAGGDPEAARELQSAQREITEEQVAQTRRSLHETIQQAEAVQESQPRPPQFDPEVVGPRPEALRVPSVEPSPVKEKVATGQLPENFVGALSKAARAVAPEGRFGPNKAFISDLYDAFAKEYPGVSYEAFQQRLLEGNRKGEIVLARADLVEAMEQARVDRSTTPYLNTHFNFVNLDYLPKVHPASLGRHISGAPRRPREMTERDPEHRSEREKEQREAWGKDSWTDLEREQVRRRAHGQIEKPFEAGPGFDAQATKKKWYSKGRKLKAPSQIVHQMMDALEGTTLYLGSPTNPHFIAQFDVLQDLITLRSYIDLRSAAHEIGHRVHKALLNYGASDQAAPNIVGTEAFAEGRRLGELLYNDPLHPPAYGYFDEGLGEFIADWIWDPELAQQSAPNLQKWWEGQLSLKGNEKLKKKFEGVRQAAQDYRQASEPQRMRAMTVSAAEAADTRSRWEQAKAKHARFQGRYVTSLHEVGGVARKLRKNNDIKSAQDILYRKEIYRGSLQGAVYNAVQGQGPSLYNGTAIADSLETVVGIAIRSGKTQAEKDELYEQFNDYLEARRIIERYGDPDDPSPQGGPTKKDGTRFHAGDYGHTREGAQEVMDLYDSEDFQLASTKWDEWYQALNSIVEQTGGFPKGIFDRVEGGSQHYVNQSVINENIDPEIERELNLHGGGLFRRFHGGQARRRLKPVEAAILDAGHRLGMAHKLVIEQTMANLIDGAAGATSILGFREPHAEQVPMSPELDKLLNEYALDPDDIPGLLNMIKPTSAHKFNPTDQTVSVPIWREDAGWVTYRIKAKVYNDLYDVGMDEIHRFGDTVLGLTTRIAKTGIISANPEFALLTAPLRDLWSIMFQTTTSPPQALYQYLASWGRTILTKASKGKIKEDPLWKVVRANGAEWGALVTQGRRPTKRILATLKGQKTAALKEPLDALQQFLGIWENQLRFSLGKAAIKKKYGYKEGDTLTDDMVTDFLLHYKRDAINFTDRGRMGHGMERWQFLFNPAVQSLRAPARLMRDHPLKFAVRSTSFAMMSLAYWWMRKDDEDYQNMDVKERNKGFHGKAGDWPFLLPVPEGPAALIKSMVEETANRLYQEDKDPKFWQKAYEVVFDNLSPIDVMRNNWTENQKLLFPLGMGLPFPTQPLLGWVSEQYMNTVAFFDTPIVPRGEEDDPYSQQYGPWTSKLAILMGEVTRWSPRRIDHTIRKLGGTLPVTLVKMLERPSIAVYEALMGTEAAKMLPAPRTDEPSAWPFLGRVFRRSAQDSFHVEEVWDRMEEIKRRQDTRFEEPSDKLDLTMYADAALAIRMLKRWQVTRPAKGPQSREWIQDQINEIAKDAMDRKKLPATRKAFVKQLETWWKDRNQARKAAMQKAGR